MTERGQIPRFPPLAFQLGQDEVLANYTLKHRQMGGKALADGERRLMSGKALAWILHRQIFLAASAKALVLLGIGVTTLQIPHRAKASQ